MHGPPGSRTIDLNADLGEEVTDDAALLAVVTSANVACGYHAGSPAIMRSVCDEAARLGVSVGAQVSYADRPGFGRVPLDVAYAVLRDQVADQVGTLAGIAAAAGTSVRYLKPHGALYHRVLDDEEQAQAVLDGSVLDGRGLPVLGMPGHLLTLAEAAGRPVLHEGFPDRGYTADGRLVPRSEPGALVTEEDRIVAQALALAPTVDSLCLHGDSPGAVEHAAAVRRGLVAAGLVLAGL
ncbi:5-oxoprolinase subunit PxpA [Nocardioides conyzicola]|uniref:5-oxoprolinase subunit PxpA n=1 Tax=Nocardioides conyzicola TaxID=1651781 RepID=A0ABP8Y5G2_9ACTN